MAERLRASTAYCEPFVQEVRRFYPFFPAVAGRARERFFWRGHRFAAGDRAILDLYGTNHHPGLWPEPERFRPERFSGRTPPHSALILQGGGVVPSGIRRPDRTSVGSGKSATVRVDHGGAPIIKK